MRGRWLAGVSALLLACGGGSGPPPVGADAAAGDAALGDATGDGGGDAGGATDAATEPTAGPTTCNPLAFTDECLPPFPSDLLTRDDPGAPTRRRVSLPAGAIAVPAGTRAIEMAPFNRADGWPTSLASVLHFGTTLEASALVDIRHPERSVARDAALWLVELGTGRRVPYLAENDANAANPARAAVIVRPLAPLQFGTRYALIVRRVARAHDGSMLPVSRGFEALRDGRPSGDPRVEAARPRYEALFAELARLGVPREEMLLATEWTTASRQHVLGPILAMRAEVVRRAATPAGLPFEIDRVLESPNPNVARLVFGRFTPPNYLRDNAVVFNADGTAAEQPSAPSYPFTMVVPARARTATAPLALTIFGHGVFGSGEDYLAGNIGRDLIQPLAEELGSVVLATDWIGLSNGDLQLLIAQVVPNINRVSLVTDRLLQSLVNNLTLTELGVGALGRDPRVRFGDAPLIDPARVYYYGVSLGGIQGSSLFSVSRHISRAVAAVPGGSWSNLLPRSTVYGPIKMFVDQRYPDPLIQTEFISLLQFRFDHTDGVNLGTLAFRAPLDDAPRGRRIVLQEAIGDCQVPNFASRILSNAMGLRQMTPASEAVFGLEPTTSPSDAPGVLAQFELVDHLRRYTPPDTNTIPSTDNNTHSDAVSTAAALSQLRTLMRDGSIVQPCEGSCNPN